MSSSNELLGSGPGGKSQWRDMYPDAMLKRVPIRRRRAAGLIKLKDARPRPRWKFDAVEAAEALQRKTHDPVISNVRQKTVAALGHFHEMEHWRDRVTDGQRVRAFAVIRGALLVAEQQFEELDSHTASFLEMDDVSFADRLKEVQTILEFGVAVVAGADKRWNLALKSQRRRPSLDARDELIVVLGELFDDAVLKPRRTRIFAQRKHEFVRSILGSNGIPCPADYDAFARIIRCFPSKNLLSAMIRRKGLWLEAAVPRSGQTAASRSSRKSR